MVTFQYKLFPGTFHRCESRLASSLIRWVVMDDNFADFKAPMSTKVTRPGVLDYLLPDFKLGIFGNLVAMVLLPLILIIVLSILLPLLSLVINAFLKRIIYPIVKANANRNTN